MLESPFFFLDGGGIPFCCPSCVFVFAIKALNASAIFSSGCVQIGAPSLFVVAAVVAVAFVVDDVVGVAVVGFLFVFLFDCLVRLG